MTTDAADILKKIDSILRSKTISALANQPVPYTASTWYSACLAGQGTQVFPELLQNVAWLRQLFGNSTDVVFRLLLVQPGVHGLVMYIDGLVDKKLLSDHVICALVAHAIRTACAELPPASGSGCNDASVNRGIRATRLFGDESVVAEAVLTAAEVRRARFLEDTVMSVLSGDTAVFIERLDTAFVVSTRGFEMRSIEEPQSESVIRGPREGFVENLRTNTALVRRKIKNPFLRIETRKVGRVTATEVALLYVEGIVNHEILDEVRSRVARINVDSILETGYIEELIEDNPYSPFPTIEYTERPDKVAADLLEGRVAILVDGTPFALLVPTTLPQLFQAVEDYYERRYIGNLIRGIRYVGFLVSLFFPSLYIATTTYHHEMIPTTLALRIAASREGVPFPALIEALLMELAIEVLREAGIRLPKPVGQALSIIGALIIGQAAVNAGLVSSAMVIVVATTAIASFAAPSFNLAITARLLRFLMMGLAAFLGFFGLLLGIQILTIHMASLRSFGVCFTAPVMPKTGPSLKDTILRAPWWAMGYRPVEITQTDQIRQEELMRPTKPQDE